MTSSTWVAIAGIAGTLLAGLLAPLVGGRVERRSRLHAQRVESYASFLSMMRIMSGLFEGAAVVPEAEMPRPFTEIELDAAISQVILVGGSDVRRRAEGVQAEVRAFYGALSRFRFGLTAQPLEASVPAALDVRLDLGGRSDELQASVQMLTEAMRRELGVADRPRS